MTATGGAGGDNYTGLNAAGGTGGGAYGHASADAFTTGPATANLILTGGAGGNGEGFGGAGGQAYAGGFSGNSVTGQTRGGGTLYLNQTATGGKGGAGFSGGAGGRAVSILEFDDTKQAYQSATSAQLTATGGAGGLNEGAGGYGVVACALRAGRPHLAPTRRSSSLNRGRRRGRSQQLSAGVRRVPRLRLGRRLRIACPASATSPPAGEQVVCSTTCWAARPAPAAKVSPGPGR